MESPQKLTKAEKRELRREEWRQEAARNAKLAQYKKIGIWGGVIVVVFLSIFGLAFLVNSSPTTSSTAGLTAPAITEKDMFTQGSKDAKVTLIEYGDFQCPACASYQPLVNQLQQEEGDKIYHAFRMFPLTNVHQNAQISAQAAYAASKQNKFWEMADLLFSNQNDWAQSVDPKSIFVKYAQDLGLDTTKFNNDMNSNEAKKFVDDSLNSALGLGLNSTPSFFINGKKIDNPNSYDEFKKLIDNELSKK